VITGADNFGQGRVELPSGRVIQNVGETLLPILPSFGLTWEF
jgi:hypothetical protein